MCIFVSYYKREVYLIGRKSHGVAHSKEQHFHAHDSVTHCAANLKTCIGKSIE